MFNAQYVYNRPTKYGQDQINYRGGAGSKTEHANYFNGHNLKINPKC